MYDFQPLGQNSIRLLQIQPALRAGDIACILNQYDDHIPPYDALSYYWGDPTPTRRVYVNDTLVDIHEALWEFLDQMQRCAETGKWIWTDFLCLNQGDNTEMGHQVPRMGHIYSNAEKTISWLGCNNSAWVSGPHGSAKLSQDLENDIRIVLKKVEAKGAAIKAFFGQPELLRWSVVTKIMLGKDHALDMLESEDRRPYSARGKYPKATKEIQQWGAGPMAQRILNILSLPYWTRVWIAQEVALAKQVIMIFGTARLEFNDFFLAYRAYFYYVFRAWVSKGVKLPVPIEARAAVYEKTATFQQIMQWGQHCEASKTVDRVYGLLGLLERCGGGIDALPSVLAQPIDYERDWREVFWEIALTYNPLENPFIVSGEERIRVSTSWVDFLAGFGDSLCCPFTSQTLQHADNERATPLCKKKARISLDVVDICRNSIMTNVRIFIDTPHQFYPDVLPPGWLTKPVTRQLWSDMEGYRRSSYHDNQILLSALLLETTEIRDMEEHDEYQAAYIGLKMLRSETGKSGWSCVPRQSREGPQGDKVNTSLRCRLRMNSSQLPCSSLSTRSRSLPFQKPHKCETLDRYLVIDRTGWRLSLKDVQSSIGEKYWRGSLNVEY